MWSATCEGECGDEEDSVSVCFVVLLVSTFVAK